MNASLRWATGRPSRHGGYWLVHETRTVKAIVETLDERLDVHTLAPQGAAFELAANDIGRVRVRASQPAAPRRALP